MNHVVINEMDNVKLRFDFNAICELEDLFGSLDNLFADKKIAKNTRTLLWVGMKWDKPGLTIREAGDMINEYLSKGHKLDRLSEYLTKAMEMSGMLSAAEEDAEKN